MRSRDVYATVGGMAGPPRVPRAAIAVRLRPAAISRVDELAVQHGLVRGEVLRQLFAIGLAELDKGKARLRTEEAT